MSSTLSKRRTWDDAVGSVPMTRPASTDSEKTSSVVREAKPLLRQRGASLRERDVGDVGKRDQARRS
ncbi:hypothetical protein MN0502_13300 [Arthrobacter sp. MN05-02]|nr:hypothetical protein MN0502_13300 [Arthrobacter sp. MN05-02]